MSLFAGVGALLAFFAYGKKIYGHLMDNVHGKILSIHFNAEQLKVLLMRASQNPQFAEKWEVKSSHFKSAGINLLVHDNTALDDSRRSCVVDRTVEETGLLWTYLSNTTKVIPEEFGDKTSSTRYILWLLIQANSHYTRVVNLLKDHLLTYLVGEGYFQSVETTDSHWAYILLNFETVEKFRDKKAYGISLEQLKQFGIIIKSGKGKLPDGVKKVMNKVWYSPYDRYMSSPIQVGIRLFPSK